MKEKKSGLFSDLIVLELGSVLACPSVGAFFAELGAQVIKVENVTTGGDVTRTWRLPAENRESDISGYFSCVNWGKKSLALDLSRPESAEILKSLIPKTDIVLVNYKPGDAVKLGTDYPSLNKLNPRIIYGHITGYGPDNPRAGYDAIIQGESGFTYMNGEPDGLPTKLPVALMDLLAAHQLKEGILLALIQRERTGRGDCIHVSLMQSGIASLANQATNWLVGGQIPERMGSDHPNIVPYGTIFSTADGKEIVLAVGSDRQFEKLCALLNRPDLAQDNRFRTNPARVQHRDEIKQILQDLIHRFTREPLLDLLQKEFIPAGAVNNMKEVFCTPQAQEMLLHGTMDETQAIQGFRNNVFHFHEQDVLRSEIPVPPHYGQHSRSILTETLGYSREKIEQLIASEVIHVREE